MTSCVSCSDEAMGPPDAENDIEMASFWAAFWREKSISNVSGVVAPNGYNQGRYKKQSHPITFIGLEFFIYFPTIGGHGQKHGKWIGEKQKRQMIFSQLPITQKYSTMTIAVKNHPEIRLIRSQVALPFGVVFCSLGNWPRLSNLNSNSLFHR